MKLVEWAWLRTGADQELPCFDKEGRKARDKMF